MVDSRPSSERLVSVVLPVHNGERFLQEAVESVLRQRHRPLEIVIVDDGSSDATAAIARGLGSEVRFFQQKHAGPAAARNLGIRKSRGDLIAFIDADDLWPDEKLTAQLRCFEAWPELDIVQGLIRRTRLPDAAKPRGGGEDIDFNFAHTNLGSMLMRRSVFDRLGFFDESLRFHEDTDFWLRVMEQDVRILVQRTPSLIYRIHGRNLTSGKDPRTMRLANVVRRSLLRRRTTSGRVLPLKHMLFMQGLRARKPAPPADRGSQDAPRPLMSIIVYGGGGEVSKLGRAVTSIRRQGYQPQEVLVVGSGLARDLAAGVEHLARVVPVDVAGDLAAGLNAAIEAAHGELIAFLDLDGEWSEGKLIAQAAFLMARPADAYVAGRTRAVIYPWTKYPPDLIAALSVIKSFGDLLSTLMVRRQAFAKVGGFVSGLSGMEEADWLMRAHDRGFARNILPQTMFIRYVEPESRLPGGEELKAALLDSVRSSVRRKRSAGAARD